MNRLALSIGAQVAAETRTRLRSPATIVTMLALFALAFLYIPDPGSHQVSISWERSGVLMSGKYTSSYIGWVVAMLTSIMLPFPGFYLVAGSIRRDIDRKIWPIVAATPTSRSAYLLGKFIAGAAYLLLLAAIGLIPAMFLFYRYGVGPFQPAQLLIPWLLLVPPSMAFTAAIALLFDVTPGLRGRGGYIAWFFVWTFGLFLLPVALSGRLDRDRSNDHPPVFDPTGMTLVMDVIARSIGGNPESLSLGINIVSTPVTRVDFQTIDPDFATIARRMRELGWLVVPLAIARLLFPLSTGATGRKPRRKARDSAALPQAAPWSEPAPTGAGYPVARAARPAIGRSILADAWLTWQTGSWMKWGIPILSLGALVAPDDAARAFTAGFMLLLATQISEAAAREELTGTGPIVFAQPGLPGSVVAWKTGGVSLFVFVAGLPPLVRAAMRGPSHGASFLLALVFVSLSAVALGWLTRGGKFFSAVFVALWYIALQGDAGLDFTGALGKVADPALSAAFAGAAAVLLVLTLAIEKARRGRA